MKLIFFGGSFDPPHRGHYEIIKYCITQCDQLILMPTVNSPLKNKTFSTEPHHILQMLALLIQIIDNHIKIDDWEIFQKRPSYTYKTIRYLKQKYSESSISMVIGSDQLSSFVDWNDRRSCILFGDGAGALAIEATNEFDNFIGFDMKTDGGRGAFLNLPSKNNKDSIVDEIDFLSGGFSPIQMNGQEVYKFAIKEVPIILEKLLKKMKYNSDQVDWLLLHQANQRILDSVGERLKIPRKKILSNLEKYGNTSAATIPLLMDEAIRDFRIQENDIIATSGFGAGLSWGAALIKWG